MSDKMELKPCPFCGGDAHTYKNNLWHVACERAHNGCVTMSAFITEAEAIAAWNSRVTDDDWEIYQRSVPATEENMAMFGWVRERTCELVFKRGAMYDVAHYSCCGYEFPELVSETGVAENYCPNCGAKVVAE